MNSTIDWYIFKDQVQCLAIFYDPLNIRKVISDLT
jgi:hypothetical protein